MQKRINITLIIAILLLALFQFGNTKKELAYIDSQKLMMNYEGMKVAVKKYQEKSVEWKARIDTLQLEFEQAMKNYEKARASMSKKERALSEEKLHVKQNQLVNYRETMQKKAKEEDGKLSAEVLGVANEYIKEFGEQQGYKIIIGATQMGNVVYADKTIDITDEALEFVNAKYANE